MVRPIRKHALFYSDYFTHNRSVKLVPALKIIIFDVIRVDHPHLNLSFFIYSLTLCKFNSCIQGSLCKVNRGIYHGTGHLSICASLDLSVHGMGWNEAQCVSYLASFGITDTTQIHKLYLQLLEEPGNYLKYYLGYLEICKLKESALALSSNWSLYDFHNWFLTTGPAPFSILTEHLEDLEISPKLLKRMSQDFHLLSVQPFHDGRNHFLMKRRMLLVG